ncbi:MAG: penicillin-binding protein activator [Cycloclasticus sp.]
MPLKFDITASEKDTESSIFHFLNIHVDSLFMVHYKIASITTLRLISFLLITLILASCASVEPSQQRAIAQSNPLQQQAQVALSRGQYELAAQLFEQLAKQGGAKQRNQYLISAIEAHLDAGKLQQAHQLVANMRQHIASLSSTEKISLAQVLLKQGKAEQSTQLLNNIDQRQLSPAQRIRLLELSSDAFFQAGNLMESAIERIALDALLQQPSAKLRNQTSLLETLSLLSQQSLDFIRPTVSSTVAGWIELAGLLRQNNRFEPNSLEVDLWKSLYPSHAANTQLLSTLASQAKTNFNTVNKLAVFLPSQGGFAKAAQSIRQGISAAAYNMADEWPLNIHFYDTSSASIEALYQQAIDEGMEAIIGPLDKTNAAKIAAIEALAIPVVSLNKASFNAQKNYYEFSLNPEEDVTQTLSLAWLKGHEKALILSPQSAYGERLAQHFSTTWQQLGGQVLDAQSYPLKQADYSTVIKNLLQLDDSIHRFKQLRQRLNLNLTFNERRRHDADFVFLIAAPREGRLIKPQLRFHRAAKLPVFSNSKIYSAELNTVANRDLDGVSFCDIPWLIEAENPDDQALNESSKLWPNTRGAHRRLLALGYDAYQIIPHLQRLRTNDFARLKGKTGIIAIQQNGLIKRQINCGYFQRGRIKSLGLAPQLETASKLPDVQIPPTNAPSNTQPL